MPTFPITARTFCRIPVWRLESEPVALPLLIKLFTRLRRLLWLLPSIALTVLGTSPRWEFGKIADKLAISVAPATMVPLALAWKSASCCAVGVPEAKSCRRLRLDLAAHAKLRCAEHTAEGTAKLRDLLRDHEREAREPESMIRSSRLAPLTLG